MSRNCPATSFTTAAEIHLLLVRCVVRTSREAREALELPRDLAQPDDVSLHGLDEAAGFGVRLAIRQHARRDLQHTERLADLVADQAAEVAQLRRLPLDGLGVAGDERVDGLLLQDAHGLLGAAHDEDRGGRITALAEDRGFPGEKRFENLAEDLILPEQLMHRCPLIEPQEPELRRLGHHRGVGGNLLIGGSAQIARDLPEQVGNVVEELMSREHVPLFDRQEPIETLEPDMGKRRVIGGQAGREMVNRGSKIWNGHRLGVRC